MAKKTPGSKGVTKKATASKVVKSAIGGGPAKKTTKKIEKKTTSVKAVVKKSSVAFKQDNDALEAPAKVKLTKSPLTKKEIAEFREALIGKRRTLVGDMSGMEAEAFRANRQDGSGNLSTMPVHMADIGTDNYEQEFTLGLLESERQLLREINEALDRIEKGTYGICLGTGNPVAKPRLTAKPWAKYCIEYARMLEQGLVRQPSQSYSSSSSSGDDDDSDDANENEEEETEEDGEVDIDDEVAAQEAEEDLAL